MKRGAGVKYTILIPRPWFLFFGPKYAEYWSRNGRVWFEGTKECHEALSDLLHERWSKTFH